MINGFTDQTKDLTVQEYQLADFIAHILRFTTGPDMAITSGQIIERMKSDHGAELSGARLRKIIHHIRYHGLVENLVASSHGYYVTTDPDEIDRYIESLNQRASSILAIARSFKLKSSPNEP